MRTTNDNATVNLGIAEVDSLAASVRLWIASDAGRRVLSEALEEAKHASTLLERDCHVKRESLHEPVTL